MIQRLCSLLRMQVPVILSRGLLGGSGSVLPTGDGWQTGAYFQKTSGTGAGFYVNEGSVTTASWRAVEAGTFTVGGTVAINITGTYTTGAIVITNASTHGIRVGAFTSGGAATNAMTLDATTSTAVEIHGGITSDPGSGTMVRPLRSRLILATVGNVEAETYGVQGQLVAKSSNLGHWHGGVLGTIECQTALSVYNPLAGVGALVGRIGGSTITVQSSCYLAGVIALASAVGVSNSGVYAGLYVTKTSGATNFSHGAYIENSDVGIAIGTCTTGIIISGTITNDAILIGSSGTPLVYPLSATQNTCVSIYADLTDPGTDKFFRGLYVRTRYMPSDTEGGASVYGIRGHVLTVATYDNVGVDENICGVHGYVTGIADALINDNGITVSGIKGELGGSGAGWDVKIACAVEAKICLTALPSSTANAYCGVSVYAPTSDATPIDCAVYVWGYCQGGLDLRGCAGDSLDWLFGLPSASVCVSASEGAVGTHGTTSRKIAILIDGVTYYLLVSTVPTFA